MRSSAAESEPEQKQTNVWLLIRHTVACEQFGTKAVCFFLCVWERGFSLQQETIKGFI